MAKSKDDAAATHTEPSAELQAALDDNTALQTRVAELEGQLEEAAANAADAEALKATIDEMEGKLEAAALSAEGGDELLAEENMNLKTEVSRLTAENEQLKKAAPDGSDATDGTKEGDKKARGEETPDWKKREYSGPLTGDQAMWRLANIYNKEDAAEVETK